MTPSLKRELFLYGGTVERNLSLEMKKGQFRFRKMVWLEQKNKTGDSFDFPASFLK